MRNLKAGDATLAITGDKADAPVAHREDVLDRPTIVELGPVTMLTGKGRQYEDGRKYDERQ